MNSDRITQLAGTLRDYQRDAAHAVFSGWQRDNRLLVSHPTGVGKTHLGMYVAGAWEQEIHKDYGLPRTVLWLAPLDELIVQAVDACRETLGIEPVVEKAERTAAKEVAIGTARIVVGSVQTMMRGSRRGKFAREAFGLVIVDEAHHVVAPEQLAAVSYFTPCKLLGLTATTRRTDQISLGKFFDRVVAHYELRDAIKDGWLCPLIEQQISVKGLDFSQVKRDAVGDLWAIDIEQVITKENRLHELVAPVVQEAGDRQTIVFMPTVRTAELYAALLEARYTKRGVVFVHGGTQEDERRELISRYKSGEAQWFVNVGVALEGFDAPATACIANLRPTESWQRKMQMVGRGLRGGPRCPVPGKTDCLLLDLTGTLGKHKLITSADLLGGVYDKEVVAAANRWMAEKNEQGESADPMELLEIANAQADELRSEARRKIIATAWIKRKTIDPFDLLDVPARQEPAWWEDKDATIDQVARLQKAGIKAEGCFTEAMARRLLRQVEARREAGLCSYKQARFLAGCGYDVLDMPAERAGEIIASMKDDDGKIRRSTDDSIRFAIQRRKREEDALVRTCERAEVLRGGRGGFRALRCYVGDTHIDVRDREKGRRVWRRLQAKGVDLADGRQAKTA